MSRRWLALGVACLLGVSACGPDSNTPLSPDSDTEALLKVTNRGGATIDVIVILNESFAPGGHAANRAAADRIARGLGLSPKLTYGTAAFGFSATIPEARLNGLQRNPHVKYVEIDRIASIPHPVTQAPKKCKDDPTGPGCGGGGEEAPATGNEVTPWGITRVGGGQTTYTGSGVAWIIDTGIDFDHADLNVDAESSVSFVTRGRNSAKDGNGHGTHVAGTIAAILGNGIDVIGVAAGATVIAVRVLDNSGSGFYSWVIAGIDHVAANGADVDVANMSLGGPPSQAVDDAVVAAASNGIMFTLAAGNYSDDANNHTPARVNGANIFTVSAIDSSDVFAWFSNYGNPPIDWAAPGVSVLSTKKGGGTTTYSGTSMAAPHVAGLLLLGAGVVSDGVASGDPDGNADPIAHTSP